MRQRYLTDKPRTTTLRQRALELEAAEVNGQVCWYVSGLLPVVSQTGHQREKQWGLK